MQLFKKKISFNLEKSGKPSYICARFPNEGMQNKNAFQ